jgi:hypothetical protein
VLNIVRTKKKEKKSPKKIFKKKTFWRIRFKKLFIFGEACSLALLRLRKGHVADAAALCV